MRTILSRYAGVPPAGWTFRANAFGRREIANALRPEQLRSSDPTQSGAAG